MLGALLPFAFASCSFERPPRTAAPEASRTPAAEMPVVPDAAAPEAMEEEVSLEGQVPLWLPNFYRALNELAKGSRQRHVRVLWFGDSHTAADFWTHAVRQPLQERFGAGGAGLVLLGIKMYRHGLAHLSRSGKWRTMPRSPAATWPQEDGVLGLAGLAATPTSRDASARIELSPAPAWAKGALRWEILYRLRQSSSGFGVESGVGTYRTVTEGEGQRRSSGLHSVVIESEGTPSLSLDAFVGEPELFGVIVEAEAPGLVIDTLGINGARAATPLAWDADAWVEEVKAREPSLIVLSYGTNEAGDGAALSVYDEQYARLLERLRAAAPEADCMLIGPTDRVGRDWISMPRVLAIDQAQRRISRSLGCAFFSPLEAMGGPGSLRRWAFGTPPLARRDRVHLLPTGYRKLGAMLVAQLLESFEARYPEEVVAR